MVMQHLKHHLTRSSKVMDALEAFANNAWRPWVMFNMRWGSSGNSLTSPFFSMPRIRNVPPKRRTHIALRGVFPQRKAKPCIDPDGLGVVERVFYNIKPGKPQVIMGCAIRLRNPAMIPHIPPERILDLIKIAAANHYRLCISLNPEVGVVPVLRLLAATSGVAVGLQMKEDGT